LSASLAGLRRASSDDIGTVTELQRAAYAKNRAILGREPLPLLADYNDIFRDYEIWLADGAAGVDGVLILEPRPSDLLIWSIATAPRVQGRGIGNRLLAAADARAIALGRDTLRLYTGSVLAERIAWYARHGYAHERNEDLGDRVLVHMVKKIA